ncbi:MAG: hypothetical protein HY275_19160 [Gemmatimonadetes bacterium]|nr:hypothetical protein [Gemmatimonadota bacterium]
MIADLLPATQGSPLLHQLFIALALAVALAFLAAVRHVAPQRLALAATLTLAWLAGTWGLAAAGVLHFAPPPTMAILIAAALALAVGLGLSSFGRALATGLPLVALVGYQGFRVAVELLLHRAYVEGLMPVQMSYAGRNVDILSGAGALAVALWLVVARPRATHAVVFAWNTLSLGFLVNILAVAILSAPTPFRVFMNEPANTWITQAPWVWLPTVMVVAALLGHVLVYRRLAIERRAPLVMATA